MKKTKPISERIEPRGYVVIQVRDLEGNLVAQHENRNLVVSLGRAGICALLGAGDTSRQITQIGVGTNSAAPTSSDAGLTSGFVKTIDSVTYPTTTSVQFAFTIGSSEANGKAIAEYALADAGGQMFARVTHPVINKTSALVITGTWKIDF